MSSTGKTLTVCVAAIGLVLASSSIAMAGAWTGSATPDWNGYCASAGTAPGTAGPGSGFFSWDGGADINDLFGTPRISMSPWGNPMFSFRTNFNVQAGESEDTVNAVQTQTDTMGFNIHMDPGYKVDAINVYLTGAFQLAYDGDDQTSNAPNTWVDIDASLTVAELNGLQRSITQTPSITPYDLTDVLTDDEVEQYDVNDLDRGVSYSGFAGISVAASFPTFSRDVSFNFENTIKAFSDHLNSIAKLDMDFVAAEIRIELVPEPGTLSLLALGAIALIRRRR